MTYLELIRKLFFIDIFFDNRLMIFFFIQSVVIFYRFARMSTIFYTFKFCYLKLFIYIILISNNKLNCSNNIKNNTNI